MSEQNNQEMNETACKKALSAIQELEAETSQETKDEIVRQYEEYREGGELIGDQL